MEIYNNNCSFQPNWFGTGGSYVFQNSFLTFLHELKCMKISVLKLPDVSVREEIDDLKETGKINLGSEKKMVVSGAHVSLPVPTNHSP